MKITFFLSAAPDFYISAYGPQIVLPTTAYGGTPTLPAPTQMPVGASALPPRKHGPAVPTPPSVTEGTTRHLGAEAPTRHLESEREE